VGQAAVSDAGTLVYIPATTSAAPEGASASGRTLVWVDRKGKEEPLAAPLNLYRFPKIPPDGTRVALGVMAGAGVEKVLTSGSGIWFAKL
jgi:hypothetical protein